MRGHSTHDIAAIHSVVDGAASRGLRVLSPVLLAGAGPPGSVQPRSPFGDGWRKWWSRQWRTCAFEIDACGCRQVRPDRGVHAWEPVLPKASGVGPFCTDDPQDNCGSASSGAMPAPPERPPAVPEGLPARKNPLSPKKLLLTKWTAVAPSRLDKHFIVVRVMEPEPPAVRIEQVELEAVRSKRMMLLHWRELTDASQWRQGWL